MKLIPIKYKNQLHFVFVSFYYSFLIAWKRKTVTGWHVKKNWSRRCHVASPTSSGGTYREMAKSQWRLKLKCGTSIIRMCAQIWSSARVSQAQSIDLLMPWAIKRFSLTKQLPLQSPSSITLSFKILFFFETTTWVFFLYFPLNSLDFNYK